jgi:hypothetical protein
MSGNISQNIHVEGSGRVLLGNEYTLEPKDQKILTWLSPLDHWAKHKEARDQYRQGTLDWFISNQISLKWLNGDIQVLWVLWSYGNWQNGLDVDNPGPSA